MALDQSELGNISTNEIARFKDKESREYKRRYTLNFQLKVSLVCISSRVCSEIVEKYCPVKSRSQNLREIEFVENMKVSFRNCR